MSDKLVVLVTCSGATEARRIARAVVEARLAACVNIVPGARSIYRWQGVIESAAEWLLIIKSSRQIFARLCAALEGAHSYQIPEVLAMPVVEGAPNYLNWLEDQLGA